MDDTEKIGMPAKKKQRVLQHYHLEYAVQYAYPVITKSSVIDYRVYCNVCKVDMNITHGGVTDISKHVGIQNVNPKQRCRQTFGRFLSSSPALKN